MCSELYMIRRNQSQRNRQQFSSEIASMDWSFIYNEIDTENAFNQFHNVLLKIFNRHFPKQKVKLQYHSCKLWLTQGLKDAIKKKSKLYRNYLKLKTVNNENIYKLYRNKLNHILKCAEKKYHSNLLDSNKDNIKKTWQIMKNIINKNKTKKIQNKFKITDGTMISDGTLISNTFNEFFVNVGPNLAKKISNQNISPLQFVSDPLMNSIFLSLVTAEETRGILSSLKNGAAGHDEIRASTLKSVSPYIVEPLAYICSLSISQGVFPSKLKIANVLPLYKADDPFLFNNYRPVSLLNVLSKVFERIMYNRVSEFLETLKILVNFQFGFRKWHSSYMALLTLMDKLISSLERKEFVIGIFLDFSKAFDTVDHAILLQKLCHYGIRGNALKWFTSYLSNRRQYVTYNGVVSAMKGINCGVPQGSILGPLLFLIYINDLCSMCKYTTPILFADDTYLFCSGPDIKTMESNIN